MTFLDSHRFGPPPPTYFNLVQLLLHAEGADAGEVITDHSSYARTLVNAAATKVYTNTAQFKFGTASLRYPGTSARLTLANAALAIGTGDFTLEMFARPGAGDKVANRGQLQLSATAGGLTTSNVANLALYCGNSNWAWVRNGASVAGGIACVEGTWAHLAICRGAGTIRLFVDGAVAESLADTTNYAGTELCLGGYYSTAFVSTGWQDEVRLTIGLARYTSSFVPPTAPFPNA